MKPATVYIMILFVLIFIFLLYSMWDPVCGDEMYDNFSRHQQIGKVLKSLLCKVTIYLHTNLNL